MIALWKELLRPLNVRYTRVVEGIKSFLRYPTCEQPSSPPRAPASRLRLTSRDLRRLKIIRGNSLSSSSQVLGAKGLLLVAQGLADAEIATTLGVCTDTIEDIVQRFTKSRFVSLEPALPSPSEPLPRTTFQAVRIALQGTQKRRLQRIANAHTSEQRMAVRAKIVLASGLGQNNCEIAHQLGIDVKTARKWRGRYAKDGLEGLNDEPRSGRPFRFDSTVRQEVFTAIVGEPPEPYSTWSLDLLSKHLVDAKLVGSISIETVSYWLRTADIKPHRVRGWLNSKDPDFRAKRDIIAEHYRNPPRDGELLSIDEKTGIQALERVRKDQSGGPGRRRKLEWEYKRHGTANLLSSFNVRTGQIIHEIPTGKNDSGAFISFLEKLMKIHPQGKLYLVLDNGTTHRSKKTSDFFAENPRLVPVFTPTHASWLNQIEIWFSVMSRHALRKASFSSIDKLIGRIHAYIELHNRELALPYEWSTKGKPLTGATARQRRRSRNILRESRQVAHC